MKTIIFGLALMMFASFLYAYSGGTDSNGCHTNSKTGEYHCH